MKIEVRPCLDKYFNEWQFLTLFQGAVEQHVRYVVEWVRKNAIIGSPTNECVCTRRILAGLLFSRPLSDAYNFPDQQEI